MDNFRKIGAAVLLLAAIASACVSLVVSMGVAAGYVLHSLIPSIDFGIATLCGLGAVGICVFVLVSIVKTYVSTVRISDTSDEDEDEYDDEDCDLVSEDQLDRLADQLTEAVLMRVIASESMSRPSSRSRR